MTGLRIAVAHPSAELYGSDLQLVETVAGFVSAGHEVTATLPVHGPLVERLEAAGAKVEISSFPVLRKSELSPTGVTALAVASFRALGPLRKRIQGADLVWVNTLTIPVWLLAGRLNRRRTFCHVHEAEDQGHRIVRTALALPLLLAQQIVCNSAAAMQSLTSVLPPLRRRSQVIHNGVPGPPTAPALARVRPAAAPVRIALVGRLSPRKGTDVALAAVAKLIAEGRQVQLALCGTAFTGYDWFENELRERAARPDLVDSVKFVGYVNPTWDILAVADIVLVPSRVEPFGNTAVEALLAERPLVASRTQGLCEIVQDGVNGLLAEPGDSDALAAAIARLIDDPNLARSLAVTGRQSALARFTLRAYRAAILAAVDQAIERPSGLAE